MIEIKHYIFCLISLLPIGLLGQIAPVATYDFDNMDLKESADRYAEGNSTETLTFECGVGEINSKSLFLDGSPDTTALDPALKDIFLGDFTLSFYFWLEPGSRTYSIFSIQDSCARDSSLSISYINVVNEIRLEYARDRTESVFFGEKVDQKNCWHHLVFTRSGDTYSFYLDGEFIKSVLFVEDIVLGSSAQVHIGYSPCVDNIETYFNGRIDEISFFDFVATDELLSSLDLFPDRVISQDTTIFQGDSYQIIGGATCAQSVIWTPGTGLSDDMITEPLATPTQTTTYQISYDHGSCTSSDSIRISVIDEESIACSNLLLPKAFTPNGDDLNDELLISNDFIITDLMRFEIYDRWGMKLFETKNKSEGWDGTFRGEAQMPGTYVYKVEYICLGDEYQKAGSFNLIK